MSDIEKAPFDNKPGTPDALLIGHVAFVGFAEREQEKIDRSTAINYLLTADFNGQVPDVIVPLAGAIKPLKKEVKYSSPNDEPALAWSNLSFEDFGDQGLVTGGKARMLAAVEAAKLFPETTIVANSYNRFNADEPTMAAVSRQELLRRGVPDSQIMLEEESFSTFTELTELMKLAVQNNWTKVSIITSDYHIPRTAEMMNQLTSLDKIAPAEHIQEADEAMEALSTFNKRGGRVAFIAAEDILRLVSHRYGEYLDNVKQTSSYNDTLESEARGLAHLKSGNYHAPLRAEVNRK
jgi:hypothetical protein